MHYPWIFVFILLILVIQSSRADLLDLNNPADLAGEQGTTLYAGGHFFAASDTIAVNEFSGQWNGAYTPKNGINLALLNSRFETGLRQDSWRIAALYRNEVLIESNREMTEIAYFSKQHLIIPTGQSFNGTLKAESLQAKGIRLDKAFVLPSLNGTTFSAGISLSLLQGTAMRVGSLQGVVTSTLSGISYDANLEDSNSKANYPFISAASPSGQGYALDAGFKSAHKNGFKWVIAANDLFGEMLWHNMPYSVAIANSATLAHDASGYLYYNPVVSGWNDLNRRNIKQKLNPRFHGQFSYPLSTIEVFAGTDWLKGYWMPQAGMRIPLNEKWQTTIACDTRFATLNLGLEHKWFYLNLRSSSLSLAQAHAYGFAAGARISF